MIIPSEEVEESSDDQNNDGGAKVNHNYEKVYFEPVINESDEMFSEKFILTNG